MSASDEVFPMEPEYRGRIVVFTISGCAFCRRAMAKLSQLQLPFVLVNLDDFPKRRSELIERTGGKTSVPQIFFNDMYLGGFDNLEEAVRTNSLARFIKEIKENKAPDSAPPPSRVEREHEFLDSVPDVGIMCELDEYSRLVRELRSSDLISDRHYHLRLYKQCFVGREFVDWLCKEKSISRDEAVLTGNELMSRKFGHHVCNEHGFKDGYFFYRLLDDDETNALNMLQMSECEPRAGVEVAEALRSEISVLYADYLSEDGRHVDYTQMGESTLFKVYEKQACELQRIDIATMPLDEERMSFFINVYNALVVHAYVARSPPKSTWERFKFFNASAYIIGGSLFSLQDIEHGVLRGNKKGPGQFKKPFSKGDVRLNAAVQNPDPRIHFALVCGAKSCPPIKTYSAANIREELSLAASSFLQDGAVVVNESKTEIQLSRILGWYKNDFGSNMKEVLKFIYDNMGETQLRTELGEAMAKNAKVSYLPYDWTPNGV